MNAGAVQAAFDEAARSLGFRFEPNFVVGECKAIGLVHAFGSVRGTLVFAYEDHPRPAVLEGLRSEGYFYSLLAESYERFEAQRFRGTLDDWGYFGPEDAKPFWYTGKAWS